MVTKVVDGRKMEIFHLDRQSYDGVLRLLYSYWSFSESAFNLMDVVHQDILDQVGIQ